MAQEGWKATGLLQPLWKTYPGGRDALAARVGSTGSVLSSINSGKRNLGIDLARRLALALDVSVLELGAPAELAEPRGNDLLLHLRELEIAVGEILTNQREGLRLLRDLRDSGARIQPATPARKRKR